MKKESFEDLSDDNPKESAGFFSLIFMSWMNVLLKTGYQRPLKEDDLYGLSKDNMADNIAGRFNVAWEEEINAAIKQLRRPRLWKALVHMISCQQYVLILCLRFCAEFLLISNAILLWFYLKMLSDESRQVYYTVVVVSGFCLTLVMFVLVERHQTYQCYIAGMRMKIALMQCIYQKVRRASIAQ